jgi:hypothetical protein
MKSFQFFKEDSQKAKERQLQSLEDLTRRREQAKTRTSQLSGSFKKRSKKRIKQITTRQKEINLRRELAKKNK